MPENEFEKKVSSEMQDLRLKPSEKVWPLVEERIRKKKKRRVLIVFFFLAGIALLGYWQRHNLFGGNNTSVAESGIKTNQDSINAIEQNKNAETKKESTPTIQTTSDEPENKTGVPGQSAKEIIKTDVKKVVKTIRDADLKTNNATTTTPFRANEKRGDRPIQNKQTTDEPSSFIVTQTDAGLKPKPAKDSIEVKVEEAEIKKEEIKNPDPVSNNKLDSAKIGVADVKKEEGTRVDSISTEDPIIDSAVIVQKPASNKKWKLGIELTPGISSLQEELFSFNMLKSAADAYGPPLGSGSGSGAPLPPAPPSESSSSFAFQVGGFATRQLTKKSNFSIGLRYAYYSESINIGASYLPLSNNLFVFLNSQGANQAFSVAGSSIRKTNHYHFIELPINYSLRLNRNENYPLLWQVGLKMGRMIGNNALVYDTIAGGIYYRSENYFNKTQFGLSTGLTWAFVKRSGFRLAAGPVFDLHLNRLQSSPFEKNKYLFFAGLRSTIIFNNKK